MKRKNMFLMWIMVLMLGLTACSPAATPTQAPAAQEKPAATEQPAAAVQPMEMSSVQPTQTPAAPAASFPVGKFVSIHDRSIATIYHPDGSFEFYYGSKDPVFVGTYSVEGDLITTENPSETDTFCIGPATYQWSFDGKKLTFAATGDDPCRGRREANADTYILDSTYTPNVEPTQAAAASTASFPTGKFVSINDKGTGVKYNEDGSFEVYFGSKDPEFVGTYSVNGDLITTENPTETDPLCIGPATYQWFFDGKQLTFTATGDDPCSGRREANAEIYVREEDYVPEVKIEAADFSYSVPSIIPAGWVKITLTNSGTESHHVQFLRLNDGVTLDQFQAALQQGEGPAMAIVKQMGGVGAIAPGGSAQAILNLPAGEYVILCLIPSPSDQTPHFAKGMIKSLTVRERSNSGTFEPKADLTVHLMDYTFEMPESLSAGPLSIKVINDGPESHEFNILKLADGKTQDDVMQFLSAPDGPPPFTPVGGMNGLDVGLSGYAELNLQPGNYVAICNIPSPKAQGHPHFSMGMIKQFSVAAP